MTDVIGIVKSVGDMNTVVGKASNKEIKKRDVQLVDKSGVIIRLTLWGAEVRCDFSLLCRKLIVIKKNTLLLYVSISNRCLPKIK